MIDIANVVFSVICVITGLVTGDVAFSLMATSAALGWSVAASRNA